MLSLLLKKLPIQRSYPLRNFNIKRSLQPENTIKSIISIRRLHINPKKTGVRPLFKGILYLEIFFLISSYLLWKRMNDSREFRYYLNENYPKILEGYYSLGENIGGLDTRKVDKEIWKNHKN